MIVMVVQRRQVLIEDAGIIGVWLEVD